MRHADGGLIERGPKALLALPKRPLGSHASYSRAQSVSRRLQRLDLGGGPLALGDALVESDKSPPPPFDEDRHDNYGQDVLLPELGLLFLRELPRVAVYQLSPASQLHPATVAGGPIGDGLHERVVHLGR